MRLLVRVSWARAGLLGLLVAAASVMAACGSSTATLSAPTVERAIATSVLAQHNLHVTVTCPTNIQSKAGTHFVCAARLDVGAYPVPGVVTNDHGHVIYANSAPLVVLDMPHVEAAISRSILAQRGVHAHVQCPAEVLQQADLRFTCKATFAGASHVFIVVERDGSGRVRYSEALRG
jgi:hypothetical protein